MLGFQNDRREKMMLKQEPIEWMNPLLDAEMPEPPNEDGVIHLWHPGPTYTGAGMPWTHHGLVAYAIAIKRDERPILHLNAETGFIQIRRANGQFWYVIPGWKLIPLP